MSSHTDPFTTDVRAKLTSIITPDPLSWDVAWKQKVTPWDRNGPQPALGELLETEASRQLLPTQGTALVPGCGTGYDMVLLARQGFDVTGLDISETAKGAADSYFASQDSIAPGTAQVVVTDFFSYTGAYDLVYDYTFFVALPPTRRPEWGSQMRRLVKSGGILVTLMFPYIPPEQIAADYVGPPWPVTEDSYTEVLGEGWEKLWDEIPDESRAAEINKGKQRIVIWKRV